MTTHEKYIVEITNAMEIDRTEDEMIKFAEHKRITLREMLEYADNILGVMHHEALMKIFKHKYFNENILKVIKDEYDLETLSDDDIEFYEMDIIDYLENYTDFENYLSDWAEIIHPDLVIGCAGYSDWSEFATTKNLVSYAKDLWDGYNFYDVDIYDLETEHLYESYGSVHIDYGNFNADYIMEEFGLDELNLINNDVISGFTKNDKTTLYEKVCEYRFVKA